MDSRQTGLVIASRRKQLHMTQQELADALGVTNKAVSKWETGQGLPDIGLLEALSDTLGVSIDALIRGELPEEGKEGDPLYMSSPLLFEARASLSLDACVRQARLQQKACGVAGTLLLPLLWFLLLAGTAGFLALYIRRLTAGLAWYLPMALLLLLLIAFFSLGYRLKGRLRYAARLKAGDIGEQVYTFTPDVLSLRTALAEQHLEYAAIRQIAYTEDALLLYGNGGCYLLEAADFTRGRLADCLAFLRARCPAARILPIRPGLDKREIAGWVCVYAALFFTAVQGAVLVLGETYRIEYRRDTDAILATAFILALLAAGCLLLFLRRNRSRAWNITASILATALAVFLIVETPLPQSSSIIRVSPDRSATLILKYREDTGRLTLYRPFFPYLAMEREILPFPADGEIKTQWLTNDICAVTYRDSQDDLHQYVATFGDRGDGISYLHVFSLLQGEWAAQVGDSAGYFFEAEPALLRLGDGKTEETFTFSDCVQFGTTALVLCGADGRPRWTLALGEDCVVENGVLQSGSIQLCPAAMTKTASIPFVLLSKGGGSD